MGYRSAVEVFKIWDELPSIMQLELVERLPTVCPELSNQLAAEVFNLDPLKNALEKFVTEDKKAAVAVAEYEKAVGESLSRVESFVKKMQMALSENVDAFDWGTMALDEMYRLRDDMINTLSVDLGDIGPVEEEVSKLSGGG